MATWYPPVRSLPPQPNYYGFGSSNQVYSNSIPKPNAIDDGDGEDQPSRPYIPDASNSVTFAPFGSVPNLSGGSAILNQITLQPADATHPGGLSTTSQIIAGDKYFIGAVSANSLTSASFVTAASYVQATDYIQAGTYVNVPDTINANTMYKQGGLAFLHNYGNANLFMGKSAGNLTLVGQGNVAVGSQGLKSLTTGSFNSAIGYGTLWNVTSGLGNTCVGNSAGNAITTGVQNTLVGLNAGVGITSGQANICIGPNTGSGVTTGNNCIDISDGSLVGAAANRTVLGSSSTAECYIAGIQGVAPGGTPQMVIINPATSKMGSQAIPSSGILSLSAIGTSPNANGATITGTVLNLQPASSTLGGVVSATTQSFAGNKTFVNQLATSMNLNMPDTASAGVGNLAWGSLIMHNYSSATRSNVFAGYAPGNYTNSGTNNVGIGVNCMTGLTSGNANVCIGQNNGITSGSSNVCIGPSAGNSLTTTSNNILISNTGTVSDSGAIKIGTVGTHTSAVLAGVATSTVSTGKQMVVSTPGTGLLESMSLAVTTSSATATLDVGSITTMTVRGVSTTTVPLAFTVIGKVVHMTIPRFQLTAQTGSALTITLSGAGFPATFYPTYDTWFMVPVKNGGVTTTSGIAYVSAVGGVIIQLLTGAAVTLPFGPTYDLNVSWNIA